MALAAVVPSHLERGAHAALLRRRIADAAALGCDLMAGCADTGSARQNHMERAGMRIAYTKPIYTKEAPR